MHANNLEDELSKIENSNLLTGPPVAANSIVHTTDNAPVMQVSLDKLEKIEFHGRAGWDVKKLSHEQLCALVSDSATLELYVEGEVQVLVEKLEGIAKAQVVYFIFSKIAFWDQDLFNCSSSGHVTSGNLALIPDGTMYYNSLRRPNGQQAAHALMAGAPMPIWVAEVEFGHSVNQPTKGFDKIRNYLMTMVGGNDEGGQPTQIEEAWLIVMYQLQPGEAMLLYAANYPPGAQVIVPVNGPLPLPTRDHPAYLVIFSRNPPGARPTSPQMAPERYCQLDPGITGKK
jgi:hypothetical protein